MTAADRLNEKFNAKIKALSNFISIQEEISPSLKDFFSVEVLKYQFSTDKGCMPPSVETDLNQELLYDAKKLAGQLKIILGPNSQLDDFTSLSRDQKKLVVYFVSYSNTALSNILSNDDANWVKSRAEFFSSLKSGDFNDYRTFKETLIESLYKQYTVHLLAQKAHEASPDLTYDELRVFLSSEEVAESLNNLLSFNTVAHDNMTEAANPWAFKIIKALRSKDDLTTKTLQNLSRDKDKKFNVYAAEARKGTHTSVTSKLKAGQQIAQNEQLGDEDFSQLFAAFFKHQDKAPGEYSDGKKYYLLSRAVSKGDLQIAIKDQVERTKKVFKDDAKNTLDSAVIYIPLHTSKKGSLDATSAGGHWTLLKITLYSSRTASKKPEIQYWDSNAEITTGNGGDVVKDATTALIQFGLPGSVDKSGNKKVQNDAWACGYYVTRKAMLDMLGDNGLDNARFVVQEHKSELQALTNLRDVSVSSGRDEMRNIMLRAIFQSSKITIPDYPSWLPAKISAPAQKFPKQGLMSDDKAAHESRQVLNPQTTPDVTPAPSTSTTKIKASFSNIKNKDGQEFNQVAGKLEEIFGAKAERLDKRDGSYNKGREAFHGFLSMKDTSDSTDAVKDSQVQFDGLFARATALHWDEEPVAFAIACKAYFPDEAPTTDSVATPLTPNKKTS